ncbi:DUF4083 family protein [Halobacillus salinus]|uniref:DUF4083 domain-containing protein n=1 Tax=Halobacillus salinus TaxID=192814 RepID=A0A4Z0GZQ1_9BACI|nr:DUF4083 family protein [Halobacillus salinus]TGB03683.1 DUF4083 domain-containing protein [Halobacillus salinus]
MFAVGDLLFQIVLFLIILSVFYLVFRLLLNMQKSRDSKELNEKLDRIIELLEKQDKHR